MGDEKSQPEDRLRYSGPRRQLEVCPKCGGYMTPRSDVHGAVRGDHWKHESRHRSFGGVRVQVFVCEQCGHTQTVQMDVVGEIEEDE